MYKLRGVVISNAAQRSEGSPSLITEALIDQFNKEWRELYNDGKVEIPFKPKELLQ